MANHKTIAVIGATDEQIAHLRLLMRQAGKQLTHAWRWGSELGADLIVVDPTVFAGQMARNRAAGSGVPCALYCDADYPEQDGLVLRRPLKLANVVDVLNRAGTPTVAIAQVASQGDDFYFRAVEEFVAKDEPAPRPTGKPVVDPWQGRRPGAAVGFDEMLKGDPLAEPDPEPPKKLLPDGVTYEATGSRSERSQRRTEQLPESAAPRVAPGAREEPPPVAAAADESRHDLARYLDSDLLGGPAQFRLDGAATLTLDPKNRMFHIDGPLEAAERYAVEPLPRKDWRVLKSTELAAVRNAASARDYEQLRWLVALRASSGRLAPHLDPGGSYRLLRMVDVSPAFREHGAVATAMRDLARVNEIANAANTRMENVFDLINAYDAIGAIEWKPRPSRYAVQEPAPKKGLLGKLFRK
jgi:hypothetical protein